MIHPVNFWIYYFFKKFSRHEIDTKDCRSSKHLSGGYLPYRHWKSWGRLQKFYL